MKTENSPILHTNLSRFFLTTFSAGPTDSLTDLDIRGGFSTSIMIERNSQDEITNIFRRDNSASPSAIFSLDTCLASPARVTEVSHVSTQTEPEPEVTCDKCDLSSRRLADMCSKLEEAKIKNDEQVRLCRHRNGWVYGIDLITDDRDLSPESPS